MTRRELLAAPAAGLLSKPALAAGSTRNLVLVTSDGLRWQDVFGGIDPKLMGEKDAFMHEARHLRDRYWRESPAERRRALMPELWGRLAPIASISDDVRVTNSFRVSYPGYSEILTGRAQDDVIRGNEAKQNPTETVLEYLRRKWSLPREQAAVFASWDAFAWISEKTPGSLVINAGYADAAHTPRIAELSRMQHEMMYEQHDARHDWITFEMGLDYLRAKQPRVLYIELDETDSWAHKKRYDRYLEMVAYVDRCLGRLWDTLESMPSHRGSTAVVITSDHGRGANLDDWTSHGARVRGAERIWLAVLGPDRPPAAKLPRTQSGIAPMIVEMCGLDPAEFAAR